jgi:hypothetical protein
MASVTMKRCEIAPACGACGSKIEDGKSLIAMKPVGDVHTECE